MKFIRCAVIAVCVWLATGCTDVQVNWHLGWLTKIAAEEDPVKKAELQTTYDTVTAAYSAWVADGTAGEPCPQWFETAMSVGFTVEEWKEPLARIIRAESNCDPGAANGESTADGLTQILDGTWRGSCPHLDISLKFDPRANLECAYYVSGGGENWNPWVTY